MDIITGVKDAYGTESDPEASFLFGLAPGTVVELINEVYEPTIVDNFSNNKSSVLQRVESITSVAVVASCRGSVQRIGCRSATGVY